LAKGHRFDIRQGRLYFLLNQALLMLKPLVSHVGNEIDFDLPVATFGEQNLIRRSGGDGEIEIAIPCASPFRRTTMSSSAITHSGWEPLTFSLY
jgi:hypothetical protein